MKNDVKFRRKSLRRVNRMMKNGVTVLFVSHSMNQVRKVCNKAILLDQGQVVFSGDLETAIRMYEGGDGESEA